MQDVGYPNACYCVPVIAVSEVHQSMKLLRWPTLVGFAISKGEHGIWTVPGGASHMGARVLLDALVCKNIKKAVQSCER